MQHIMLKEESAPQASIRLCNHRLVLEQFSISSLNMDSSTVRKKGKVKQMSFREMNRILVPLEVFTILHPLRIVLKKAITLSNDKGSAPNFTSNNK